MARKTKAVEQAVPEAEKPKSARKPRKAKAVEDSVVAPQTDAKQETSAEEKARAKKQKKPKSPDHALDSVLVRMMALPENSPVRVANACRVVSMLDGYPEAVITLMSDSKKRVYSDLPYMLSFTLSDLIDGQGEANRFHSSEIRMNVLHALLKLGAVKRDAFLEAMRRLRSGGTLRRQAGAVRVLSKSLGIELTPDQEKRLEEAEIQGD